MRVWVEHIGSVLRGQQDVHDQLMELRGRVASKALADAGLDTGEGRDRLQVEAKAAFECLHDTDADRMASFFLICLEASKNQPRAWTEFLGVLRAALPQQGWWSVFENREADPEGTLIHLPTGLPPKIELQLRLVIHLRSGREVSAEWLLQEWARLSELPHREGARALLAILRHRPSEKPAKKALAGKLPLSIQLALDQFPNLSVGLFGATLDQLGVEPESIRSRWDCSKAFGMRWRKLESLVRAREWKALAERIGKREDLPEPKDRLAFHGRVLWALRNPFAFSTGSETVLSKRLHGLLVTFLNGKKDVIRLLDFFATPCRVHALRGCESRSYLNRKPSFLPAHDWANLLSRFDKEHKAALTRAKRFDLLTSLDRTTVCAHPKEFLPFLANEKVARVFADPENLPKLARLLTNQLETKVGPVAVAILSRYMRDQARDSEDFIQLLTSFRRPRSLKTFLAKYQGIPWRSEEFLEALETEDREKYRGIWLPWLLTQTPTGKEGHKAWIQCLSSMVLGSLALQRQLVHRTAEVDLFPLFVQLAPATQAQILAGITCGKIALPQGAHGSLRVWAEEKIGALIHAERAKALHEKYPEFIPGMGSDVLTELQRESPSILVEMFSNYPDLLKAWGSSIKGIQLHPAKDLGGATLLALRAAYRPRSNWGALARLDESLREQALDQAIPILRKAHPSRAALLELGRKLGIRWLSTLSAAAARRDFQASYGHRLDALYRTYELPKRSGGCRIITVPPQWLKRLQRAILDKLLEPLGCHPSAHGFVRGRSILSNASNHVGKPVVVGCDIQKAFPSTSWRLVRHALTRDLGAVLSKESIGLLIEICCHGGGLPIGAPSSPALLNRVLLVADEILATEAAGKGVSYSRYADDLCFSGDERALQMLPVARRVLGSAGLSLDPRKTNIFRKGRRQVVTGLVVNEQVSTSRRMRKKLRAAVHRKELGREATWHDKPMDSHSLMGRLAFVKMVNPDHAGKLIHRLRQAKRNPE